MYLILYSNKAIQTLDLKSHSAMFRSQVSTGKSELYIKIDNIDCMY